MTVFVDPMYLDMGIAGQFIHESQACDSIELTRVTERDEFGKDVAVRYATPGRPKQRYRIGMQRISRIEEAEKSRRVEQHLLSWCPLDITAELAGEVSVDLNVVGRMSVPGIDSASVPAEAVPCGL